MIKFYMRKAKRKKGQKDKQWSPNYYTENQWLLYTNPTEKPKHSPAFLSMENKYIIVNIRHIESMYDRMSRVSFSFRSE
jgi:hypothetical protein